MAARFETCPPDTKHIRNFNFDMPLSDSVLFLSSFSVSYSRCGLDSLVTRLWVGRSGFDSRTGARNFLRHRVQTVYGVHPISSPMGNRDPLLGGKTTGS
jgi:hypothetical protein